MNCIVIDENPASQKVMTEFINQDPHLKLKANCFSAFDSLEVLLSINKDQVNGLVLQNRKTVESRKADGVKL